MYFTNVPTPRRLLLAIALTLSVAMLAACGSSGAESAVSTTVDAASESSADDEDDHGDEDHSDEDDHDDENHSDEDDHSDEDHDDDDHDDHDDEDHDDHDDDDHKDDDHDDHDDDDHKDDDHDDEDHKDEDHDDEDHKDEDHDDHDDHDDEDHDDHDHDDEESASGSLDAHVHGSAELFVAWSGGDVVVDLISPAINVFGFEYEPTTDQDVALVAERTEVLTSPDLLAFNAEARCALSDDVDSDFVVEGSHAEVTTSWLFTCDEPGELRELNLATLFAEFPRMEDVDAQWASDNGQSAAELSPSSTILRFE